MKLSNETGELFKAFAKFQGELDNATKNLINPGVKNKYADLAQCINTAKPVLASNGLGVTQMIGCSNDGKQTLITMMTHESGQYMSSEFLLVDAMLQGQAGNNPAQVLGSAITYQRRYAFAAIIGMAQQDDDGNSVTPTSQYQPQQHQPQQQKPSSSETLKIFTALIGSCTTTQACNQAKEKFFVQYGKGCMNTDDLDKAKAVFKTHSEDLKTKGE